MFYENYDVKFKDFIKDFLVCFVGGHLIYIAIGLIVFLGSILIMVLFPSA
jgi:hypothetical protein